MADEIETRSVLNQARAALEALAGPHGSEEEYAAALHLKDEALRMISMHRRANADTPAARTAMYHCADRDAAHEMVIVDAERQFAHGGVAAPLNPPKRVGECRYRTA